MTDDQIPVKLKTVLRMIFLVVSSGVAIAIVTPRILLLLPVLLLLLLLLIQSIYLRTSRQLMRLKSATKSPIYSLFGETLQGISTIRAFKRQKTFLDECRRLLDADGRAW